MQRSAQVPARPAGPPYRVVFMGTPDFALPSLLRLAESQAVVAVFTQPDRPAGRGRSVQASPVKRAALAHGIPVFQPASLRRDPAVASALRGLAPDVVVVAAYGLILPPEVLTAAPGGALNVHASLLPRWRGAAPVSHAILAGDAVTGATIMLVDEGLDTGPILAQATLPLPADASAGAVTALLAELGAALLADTLPRWMRGEITPTPQDGARATKAPRLSREEGRLDWSLPAADLARRVRALDPWPGTFTQWAGGPLKVLAATPLAAPDAVAGTPAAAVPGTVALSPEGPVVATGAGWLRLDHVQPAGRAAMTGAAFARGRPDFAGRRLGEGMVESV